MKLVVIEKHRDTVVKYPCLKKNKNTGLVIFFYAPNSGVVLGADQHYTVGTHGNGSWSENEDFMVPFKGSITISED